MRRCKGRVYVCENGKWNWLEFSLGYFHQWGINYEEFETGPGNYTTAVVELPDGRIVTPPADDIIFLDKAEDFMIK